MKLQECFKKVSRVFHESFKVEECLKGVFRGFQEYLKKHSKGISGKFQIIIIIIIIIKGVFQ